MTKIGFIGTGVMGQSLVRHLLRADYEVHIFNRTKAKALALLDDGAYWEASPKDVAAQCPVIMTMVGYPADVEDIYFSQTSGILAAAEPGSLLIDLTTSTPSLAKKIAEQAALRQIQAVDAPVSGGDSGAKAGTLTIMCGGDQQAYRQAAVYLSCFGKHVAWLGPAGSGQHAKMCNQIVIAGTIMGVCEALSYAQAAGLNAQEVLASISQGAAASWQLSNNGQKIIDQDYQPGFYIKHFIKDMKIALDEAELMKLDLPGLALAKKLYEKVALDGNENLGTQALIYWYQHSQQS